MLILPKEQVEVMERIFGDNTSYSEETLDQLKKVMLQSEQSEADILIYGKTGRHRHSLNAVGNEFS